MDDKLFNEKKVLVVDDQAHFLDAVAFEFQLLGCTVLKAAHGKAAFEIFKKNQNIDLIVSDIRMPEWDGEKFLNELRKISSPNPPFVFMTGFADLKIYEAFDRGADLFLGKPLDPDTFPGLVAKLLAPLEERWAVGLKKQPVGALSLTLPTIEVNELFQMGRSGFFIASQCIKDFTSLGKGNLLKLDLSFESGPISKLTGAGTILWIRRDAGDAGLLMGCGIQFEALDDESNKSIVNYLKGKAFLKTIPKGAKLS